MQIQNDFLTIVYGKRKQVFWGSTRDCKSLYLSINDVKNMRDVYNSAILR